MVRAWPGLRRPAETMTTQTPDDSWTIPSLPPLEPADETADLEADEVPETIRGVGAPSVKVVLPSLFLLSGLGLGAFLLMYSSVHAGDARVHAGVQVAVGAAAVDAPSSPALVASATAPRVPVAVLAPTPTESPAPAPPPAPVPSSIAVAALPAAPVPVPVEAPVVHEVAPVARELHEVKVTAPPRPVYIAPKPAVVVRIEANPVFNPVSVKSDDGSSNAAPVTAATEPRAAPAAAANAADSNPYDQP
jgi:hypothetical protein